MTPLGGGSFRIVKISPHDFLDQVVKL